MFDTRELGRRPGAMRRVSRSVPAPGDFGVAGVVGVPEDAAVEVELRLESVVEGVLVTGTARTTVSGECVRCLEPVGDGLEVGFQELYHYPDEDVRAGGPTAASREEDDDTYRLEGDLLDLRPVLRDAVVLALPLQPVCREDCPGLCSECGARLADDPDHHHEAADPRWAALQGLSAALPEDGGNDDDSGAGNGSAENQEK